METKTIKVDYLARVEGEGSLVIRFEGNTPVEVKLQIFEPPRFFEAFLRGRSQYEAPDLTSRICGICPVAYLMSSVAAIEDILGLEIPPEIQALRRLLYCGEWIESHALHVFMLHAPDFPGYDDAIAMAKDHPEIVKKSLRLKKAGNAIVALLGGREIHPVNIRVGGFYRAPTAAELRTLLPELIFGREAMREALSWMSGFSFPELERDYELVAVKSPGEYPILGSRIASSRGLDIPVREYEAHFIEEHVARSNALHSRLKERGSYFCGPLARFNLSFDELSSVAKSAALAAGLRPPCKNPFKSLLIRAVEVIEAFEQAIQIIEGYSPPARPYVEAAPRAGTGYGCTEAPRGLLYHRYTVDERGIITDAKIVPPTSQNQMVIEEDLLALAPALAELPLDAATLLAEQAVRNYDPCISCATHFLTLKIERG